jgi:hypothetical protein
MKSGSIVAASALILAVAGISRPALAQGIDDLGTYGFDPAHAESPQNMAVELRVGRYYPGIDDEFAGDATHLEPGSSEEFAGPATPFQKSFGKKMRWIVGFELDWQVLRIPYVGTLGPGVGLGYTTMSGKVFLDDGKLADETTKLSILPAYLVAVLRIDTLTRYTPVPLAFYGKAGLSGAYWWTRDDRGVTHAEDGSRGDGTSYGYHVALGGMLQLDVFDRGRARDMDSTLGINHSYLFAEWYKSSLNGFNSGSQMQVGSSSWTAGIALEL